MIVLIKAVFCCLLCVQTYLLHYMIIIILHFIHNYVIIHIHII